MLGSVGTCSGIAVGELLGIRKSLFPLEKKIKSPSGEKAAPKIASVPPELVRVTGLPKVPVLELKSSSTKSSPGLGGSSRRLLLASSKTIALGAKGMAAVPVWVNDPAVDSNLRDCRFPPAKLIR